mmetsp:Transcript_29055/g.55793  ORF Transcript_29055/g.55793 Transcript_29055/m.55793 type:complete len:270 (-) Transcript_29055:360-1169(-)
MECLLCRTSSQQEEATIGIYLLALTYHFVEFVNILHPIGILSPTQHLRQDVFLPGDVHIREEQAEAGVQNDVVHLDLGTHESVEALGGEPNVLRLPEGPVEKLEPLHGEDVDVASAQRCLCAVIGCEGEVLVDSDHPQRAQQVFEQVYLPLVRHHHHHRVLPASERHRLRRKRLLEVHVGSDTLLGPERALWPRGGVLYRHRALAPPVVKGNCVGGCHALRSTISVGRALLKLRRGGRVGVLVRHRYGCSWLLVLSRRSGCLFYVLGFG